MCIELDFDETEIYEDKMGKDWFLNFILLGSKGELVLHSNYIGESIGTVKGLSLEELDNEREK